MKVPPFVNPTPTREATDLQVGVNPAPQPETPVHTVKPAPHYPMGPVIFNTPPPRPLSTAHEKEIKAAAAAVLKSGNLGEPLAAEPVGAVYDSVTIQQNPVLGPDTGGGTYALIPEGMFGMQRDPNGAKEFFLLVKTVAMGDMTVKTYRPFPLELSKTPIAFPIDVK